MDLTYNPNVPVASLPPANAAAPMQQNFSSISSLIEIDHVGFNNASGGYHEQVTFAANNVPSPPVSPPVLFTNNVSSLPQLFFYSGDANHSSNQYVLGSLSSGQGSILLFGGIIIKWFNANINASSLSVSFSTLGLNNFPNSVQGACVTTQSFLSSGGYTVGYQSISTSGIVLQKSPGNTSTTNVFVVVIGN